ncbi:MAG: benzoate-CoA ligase family protein [Chloroflexota bacterium]|nr:benzoate-CoA ligase family protein [Chloroflexota bacterium]
MPDVPERYNAGALLDANLDAGRAGKTAIVCGDERVTYGELHARACAMGRALRALGHRREERVLLVLDDTPAFAVAFWGAIRLGSVPVPINPLLRVDDFRFFVEDTGARVVIAEPAYLAKLGQALEGLAEPPMVIATGDDPMATCLLGDLLATHQGDLPLADTHRDDIALVLYSGGSTGRPKGIVHLHHDIPYTCEAYARHVARLTGDDIVFARALFHAYGLGAGVTFPCWAGATAVLRPGRATPLGILETVREHRPSLVFLVPTLYNAILNDPAASQFDLSSVRLCVSAAEPLAPEVWRRWKETFGLEILDGIGSTELLHIFCSNTPDALRPGSSGRPVPGYDLRILGDDGEAAAVGQVGDLLVRGDSGAPCYWHQHAKSQRTMRGEWIHTGDRYRCDDEGFYWYEGRSDDMIKVRGEWVSPIEIENVLCEYPAVHEAAVVGVPVDGVTTIKATVVLRVDYEPSPLLARELQDWCKARLQRYQFPQAIDFVDELPKTLTGKIQRFVLREGTA